jgi:hypothetical protein
MLSELFRRSDILVLSRTPPLYLPTSPHLSPCIGRRDRPSASYFYGRGYFLSIMAAISSAVSRWLAVLASIFSAIVLERMYTVGLFCLFIFACSCLQTEMF